MDTSMMDVDGEDMHGSKVSVQCPPPHVVSLPSLVVLTSWCMEQIRQRDLIRTIRALEQTGPGDNGQHIESIWTALTSIGPSNYFAAEESVLRWLLKSTKPNNEAAETLRRFPLTWRILGCTFQRIPLFSLAKSLADRKFMAILQQTLVAVAKPSKDSARSAKSTKRKRTPTYPFQLESLKSREGCVATGEAILDAVRLLLERLEHRSSLGLNDKVGAEHIKALFSQPATEVVAYLGSVLTLCDLSTTCDLDLAESQASWVQTLTTMWDLRLQGHTDALEAAMFLSRPGFGLLGKLFGFSQDVDISLDDRVKAAWAEQLESFMHRNLMLPAKSAFLNWRDLEIPTSAVDVSKAIAAVSVPVFFRLATRAPRILGGLTASKAEGEWTEEAFKLAYRRLNKLEPSHLRSSLLRTLLQDALSTRSQLRLEDLRSICEEYALNHDSTDWPLLSLIAQCDPDAFLLTDKGERLFDMVSERLSQDRSSSTSVGGGQADQDAAKMFLDAIIGGFEKARDLPGFLRRWYMQLTKCDRSLISQPDRRPVWFTDAVHRNSRLSHLIETSSMTPKQLLIVLQWVEDQGDVLPEARLVFLDTIASSITDDDTADVVGPKIFHLVETVWSSAHLQGGDLRSLRWPILAKTVSWADFENATKMQTLIRPELDKVLLESQLDDPDTFRAFQCATSIWLSSYPDGPNEPGLSGLLSSFSERLAEHVQEVDPSSPEGSWDPTKAQEGAQRQKLPLDDSQPTAASYVDFSLGVASRLLPLLSRKSSSRLPTFLQRILAAPPVHDASSSSSSGERLTSALNAVFSNETNYHETHFIGKVVDYVIDTMEFQSKSGSWDDVRPKAALRSLSSVPDELLSRQQRERIMEILHGQRRKIKGKTPVSPSTWALVLGLMAKVMRRPTFYSGMAFKHLTSLASSVASSVSPSHSVQALGMGRLVYDVSLATLRQMNDHFDEWGSEYFRKAKRYIFDADDEESQSALRLPIFKALVSVVSSSSHFAGNDEAPFTAEAVQSRLAQLVKKPLEDYADNWRSLDDARESSQINDLLLAIDASGTLTPDLLQKMIKPKTAAKLEKASQQSISRGHLRGWRLRTFLIKNFPESLSQPRPTDLDKLFSLDRESKDEPVVDDGEVPGPVDATNPRETLEACVDAIVANLDHAQRLEYIEGLIDEIRAVPVADGHLLGIRRIVGQMTGKLRFSIDPDEG